MPTQTQILNQVKKVVRRSQAQHFRVQTADERALRSLYRDSLKKVNAKVTLLQGNPQWLERVQRDLEKEIRRLSDRISRTVSQSKRKAATFGIKGAVDSMKLYEKGFPRGFKVRPDSKAFGRIFTGAIRAASVPIEGISLSGKIWDLNRISLESMNRHLARSMAQGKSITEITQEMRRFLLFPDADLRKKKWRQFFKDNPPGRGVHRSAHKNIERVLRTESNRAFRIGAAQYAKDKKWVLGLKWLLSPGHPESDICDGIATADMYGLGPGVYPPGAVPDSGHPNCICYTVNVVKPEYNQFEAAEPPTFETKEEAKNWVQENLGVNHVEWGNHNINQVNAMVHQLNVLHNKFPRVSLNGVGDSFHISHAKWKEDYAVFIEKDRRAFQGKLWRRTDADKRVRKIMFDEPKPTDYLQEKISYMGRYEGRGFLNINSDWTRRKLTLADDAVERAKAISEGRQLYVTGGSIQNTVNHEYGHYLDRVMAPEGHMDWSSNNRAFLSWRLKAAGRISDDLTQYAAKNHSETFAELFADSFHETKRPLTQEFLGLFGKELGL